MSLFLYERGVRIMTKSWQDGLAQSYGEQFGSVGTLGGTATGTIHAAAVGTILNVTDIFVASEGAATVKVGSGTPTTLLAEIKFGAAGNQSLVGLRTPLKTAQGAALVYSTGGGTVAVTATGYRD